MVKKSSRRTKRDVKRTKRYVRRSKRDVRRSKRNVRRTKRVMRGGMEKFPHGRSVHTGDDADFQRILAMAEEESRKAEQERLERVRELEKKEIDDIIAKSISDGITIEMIAYSNKGNDRLLQRLALLLTNAELKIIDNEAKYNMEKILEMSEKNPELLTELVKIGYFYVERPDPTKLLMEILTELRNMPDPNQELSISSDYESVDMDDIQSRLDRLRYD